MVRHLHRRQPRTEQDIERLKRKFVVGDRASAQKLCGFAILGFIGLELLSWLVQRAFDWILEWWQKSHHAAEAVAGMCFEPAGLSTEDE